MAEIRAYRGVESTNEQKAGPGIPGARDRRLRGKYDDAIEALAPVLSEALASDAWADVCGSGWYMSACEDAGNAGAARKSLKKLP